MWGEGERRVVGTPQSNNYRYYYEKEGQKLEGQQDFYNKLKSYIPEFKDLSVDVFITNS